MSTLAIPGVGAYFLINILLQAFDGILTYQVLLLGVPEANPLIHATIIKWGPLWGLFPWKTFACVLLLFIYMSRHRCRRLTVKAFTMTATVYAWFGFLSLCELFLLVNS